MFENECLSVAMDGKLCLNKVAQSFDLFYNVTVFTVTGVAFYLADLLRSEILWKSNQINDK